MAGRKAIWVLFWAWVTALHLRLVRPETEKPFGLLKATDKMIRATRGRGYACGSDIPRLLSFLCGGHYNSLQQKRGVTDATKKTMSFTPFLSHEKARDFFSRPRRWVTGPHQECCAKPCYLSELFSYCHRQDEPDWTFGVRE